MNDFQRYFVNEFVEEYREGHMSRRDMMKRVLYITGGVASTATLLASLGCTPAASPTAAPAAKPTSPPAAAPTAAPTTAPTAAPTTATPAATAPPKPTAGATSAAPAAASPVASAAAAPAGKSPISVAANDPAIEGEEIKIPGDGVQIIAYQTKPKGAGPFPLVLVCHENRGLTDHIRDVTRRFAKEGYAAAALDLLSRNGGTASIADQAQIPALLSGQAAPPERHVGDFQAAIKYYAGQPALVRPGAIGMTGFCFGGGVTWRTAAKASELKAIAPWYGPAPSPDEIRAIKTNVLGIFASNDAGVNAGRDTMDPIFKAAGLNYQLKTYPNTMHAFNNDTGASYNQEQALAAWKDLLEWFAKYVRG